LNSRVQIIVTQAMPNSRTQKIVPPNLSLLAQRSTSQELLRLFRAPIPTGGDIEKCFRKSNLLMLASLLASNLKSSEMYLDPAAEWADVSGFLNLSHDEITTSKSARCLIKLSPEWSLFPPRVWCLEPWVRFEPDWHAGVGTNKDQLCYVLAQEWCDLVAKVWIDEGPAAALAYAAGFCLRNIQWLLYRHYIGHITQMSIWPTDWPSRPHNLEKALKQYRQQICHTKKYEYSR